MVKYWAKVEGRNRLRLRIRLRKKNINNRNGLLQLFIDFLFCLLHSANCILIFSEAHLHGFSFRLRRLELE